MITELFYSRILNTKRGSLHTRSFRPIHLSPFSYRLTENGFTGPKNFRGFREKDPRIKDHSNHGASKNRWKHTGRGFIGSFDAPWSAEWFNISDLNPDHPQGTKPNLMSSQIVPSRKCCLARYYIVNKLIEHKLTTVEPPVSDRPKYQVHVVPYESLDHIGSNFCLISIWYLPRLTPSFKCFICFY